MFFLLLVEHQILKSNVLLQTSPSSCQVKLQPRTTKMAWVEREIRRGRGTRLADAPRDETGLAEWFESIESWDSVWNALSSILGHQLMLKWYFHRWYLMISDITTVYRCMYIPSFCESFSLCGLRISHGHLHGLCGRSHGCTPAWCSRICRWKLFPSNWMDRWTDQNVKSKTVSKLSKYIKI